MWECLDFSLVNQVAFWFIDLYEFILISTEKLFYMGRNDTVIELIE